MPPDVKNAVTRASYPNHQWGPWAIDPWGSDVVPDTICWRTAMKRAWLRDGGTEVGFDAAFPNEMPRQASHMLR